jgi:hypothetical protein
MNYFIGFILKRKTTINKSIDFFNYLNCLNYLNIFFQKFVQPNNLYHTIFNANKNVIIR